jgi:hypothetical protein
MPIYTEVSPGYWMNMRSNYLSHNFGIKTYQKTVVDNGEYQKNTAGKKGVIHVFS